MKYVNSELKIDESEWKVKLNELKIDDESKYDEVSVMGWD